MAQTKNPILRIAFPVVLLVLAVVAAWAIKTNTGRATAPGAQGPGSAAPTATQSAPAATPVDTQPTPPTTTTTTTPTPNAGAKSPAAPSVGDGQGATGTEPAAKSAPTDGAAAPVATAGLEAKVWTGDANAAAYAPIGSVDPAGEYLMRVEFSPLGAGVRSIALARSFDDLKDTVHTEIQTAVESQNRAIVPMAALWADVNGAVVPLAAQGVWRQRAGEAGVFEAEVVDGAGATVLRLERRYELPTHSYRFGVRQSIRNVTGAAVSVKWHQFGPVDLAGETTPYGGDRRRVRFGYLLNPTADPTRRAVVSNEFIQDHQEALGSVNAQTGAYPEVVGLWPNAKSMEGAYQLVWTALTSRFFGVAVHPYADPTGTTGSLALPNFESVERFVWSRYTQQPDGTSALDPVMALRLNSQDLSIAPGGSADLSVAVFAGPLSLPLLKADPITKDYGLPGLVVFNMYSSSQWWCCCAWPPVGAVIEGISVLLFSLMHVLHDYLVLDWSLAIVLLVVCVRTVLHPLTKWSQIRMQRFAKQMQGMAPKQKQIQERYRDDKKRLQEEMAKLWREEGVSPLGMIGCAPMVLVTPIWIGLYAMLYFAFELRHTPAFFGLIQKIAPSWPFMADLSAPDRIFDFGRTLVTVPILGPISSVNVLPLILGAVFFVHQKYLTPPSTAPLTPEQEMQQKMVKMMSVVMFPLFMYNAPSGLAVYFITNSALAIFENKYIRAHIDKHDLLNHKKKPGAQGGFMARLMKAAEERTKRVDQARSAKGKK